MCDLKRKGSFPARYLEAAVEVVTEGSRVEVVAQGRTLRLHIPAIEIQCQDTSSVARLHLTIKTLARNLASKVHLSIFDISDLFLYLL